VENYRIPFSSFRRRLDYQPPGQDMSGTLDLDNIDSIHFMYANNKSGKFVVDNIKLIGATSDPTPSIKHGDLNFDNAVNSTDLLMLKRYILNLWNSVHLSRRKNSKKRQIKQGQQGRLH